VIRIGRQSRLVLDDRHRAEATSPPGTDVVNLFSDANQITFGARLRSPRRLVGIPVDWPTTTGVEMGAHGVDGGLDEHLPLLLDGGVVGCFGRITLDGVPVPKTQQALRLHNTAIGCDPAQMGPCLQVCNLNIS
jgi:hypothetical protein